MKIKLNSRPTKKQSSEGGAESSDNSNILSKITRGSPWAAAAGLGLLGTAGGYVAADTFEGMLDSQMHQLAQLSPGFGDNIGDPKRPYLDVEEEKERMKRFRRRFAALTGLAAASPMIYYGLHNQFSGDPKTKTSGELSKVAHFINYSSSLDTIQNDRFLNNNQKNQVTNILSNANNRAPSSRKLHGMLSTSDVIKGAVGAGVGRTLASGAGSLLASTMSLPKGMQKRLSDTGMLAGSLIGSKIVS